MSKPSLGRQSTSAATPRPHGFDATLLASTRIAPEAEFDNTVNAIVQMMSETANDLRTPLTAVRASLRSLAAGQQGELSTPQLQTLCDAISQCDCMDQIVGEMMQLQRLRAGLPRVRRRWVAVTEIRHAVDESLRPWLLRGQVDVLWDGADDSKVIVFADPDMLRRLLVNLVASAIRTSVEGEAILIRLQMTSSGGAITWSVVDRGEGISQQQMKQIELQHKSSARSEGLGLAISRQLAALHFSSLRLRSRVGWGTEVSFQTPVSGSKSVAESWVRWRQRGGVNRRAVSEKTLSSGTASHIQRHVRLDPPMLSVELGHDSVVPRLHDLATVTTVSMGAAMSRADADQFDSLLQRDAWLFDLIYRVDTRRWICVLDGDSEESRRRALVITEAARRKMGSVRLDWGLPSPLDLQHRGAAAKLSDLFVRETLTASSSHTITDANQVRLGTAPIVMSPVAAERLDEELRRLSERLQRQAVTVSGQAEMLRP
ncbi:ATP-binding region, ATPase-like domain protein [Rhodopirellula maiorica SM1]|uniref:histidine kinase n=1 Tax=Rhodopirellula maiorica SM1 TaxID=1265738 RepID=M5RWZ0_9BACT|nr:HAMP domain-containing sensor histidine kinase [Rhodopirellula maiorica]EMI18469.1 ATP-binding region, ATPase-like domain protein [Rhodopirellula maiorica SM1]